jgi:hypothetical protein
VGLENCSVAETFSDVVAEKLQMVAKKPRNCGISHATWARTGCMDSPDGFPYAPGERFVDVAAIINARSRADIEKLQAVPVYTKQHQGNTGAPQRDAPNLPARGQTGGWLRSHESHRYHDSWHKYL